MATPIMQIVQTFMATVMKSLGTWRDCNHAKFWLSHRWFIYTLKPLIKSPRTQNAYLQHMQTEERSFELPIQNIYSLGLHIWAERYVRSMATMERIFTCLTCWAPNFLFTSLFPTHSLLSLIPSSPLNTPISSIYSLTEHFIIFIIVYS